MYQELIGKVLRDKHRFGSDDTLSPESYRVWQSLEREGYKLRKAPGVREITIGEEVGYRGPRNEPIFEVIGLPIKKEKPLSPPKVKPKSEEVRIAERMLAIHQNADRAYQRAQRIQAFQNAPLDRARALRDAQRGDVAALVQKVEEAAPTKTDTIMAAVKKEATVVTDTVDIKKDQTRQFTEWLKTQKLPPGYDAEFLQQLSLENATDIPPERIFEVAKSTAYQYIDDIEMAREAGIADY
jgi:hypothetical protein